MRSRSGRRRRLPEEVADYVREQIMSGRYRPGDFLRTEPIADAVGVSNTPVREGLLGLRSEGFVELVPRRGFIVAQFTRQDVRDLFWAQAQLAGELAARAAERITSDQVSRLESIIEHFDDASKRADTDVVSDLGHAFHREINLAAESRRLALLLASVVRHLPNRFYASIEAQVELTRKEHPRIVDALRQGEVRTARKLMQDHVVQSADYVIGMLEQRGLWEEAGTTP
jgi:DNA-binding GntR family transcriptional regulator